MKTTTWQRLLPKEAGNRGLDGDVSLDPEPSVVTQYSQHSHMILKPI